MKILGAQRALSALTPGLRQQDARAHAEYQLLSPALRRAARRFAGLWLCRGAGGSAAALAAIPAPVPVGAGSLGGIGDGDGCAARAHRTGSPHARMVPADGTAGTH